jgi:protein CpxP
MKTWIKRTLIGLLGAGALFGGLAAWAGHHHARWGHGAMSEQEMASMQARVLERVGQRLELDETQKARLATLADTLREQRKQFMAGGRSPRDEINALIGRQRLRPRRGGGAGGAQDSLPPTAVHPSRHRSAMADFYDSLNGRAAGQGARVRRPARAQGGRLTMIEPVVAPAGAASHAAQAPACC